MTRPDLFAPLAHAARHCFAPDHTTAQARFLADGAAGTCRAYPSSSVGPAGDALATDCLWVGAPDAPCVLVVISGTHGVEGYSGSAIQRDWLSAHAAGWPSDAPALLMIHALNPYGFAHDRRVTADGCDLNRNFIDFAAPPTNEGYREIAAWLVPSTLDDASVAWAEQRLADWRAARGEFAFQCARKSGQSSDPRGMFYTGRQPSEPHRTLEHIFADYRLAERRFVTVIDVHTGLGPYGYGEPQSEHDPASASHALAAQVFGPSLTSPALGTSFSVPLHGTMQAFWDRRLVDGRHLYVCLEFGTFDQEASRRLYREDHWFHGYGPADPISSEGRDLRRRMRAHFDPDEPSWREMVLMRGRQVIAQAIAHLERERSRQIL